MVASLFGCSSLPLLRFDVPPPHSFGDRCPITFTVTLSVKQPVIVSLSLLTADYQQAHRLQITPQQTISFAESTTHKFEDLYIEDPAQSDENQSTALAGANLQSEDTGLKGSCNKDESVRIMVEAATASSSSVIVSDVMYRDNTPIEVVQLSHSAVKNKKEVVWLLLNKSLSDASIFVDIGNRMLPAERLKVYDKLIIFSLPVVVIPEKTDEAPALTDSFKIFLRSGSQQLELPLQLHISEAGDGSRKFVTDVPDAAAQIASLFEFATEGEPLALMKPLVPFLAASDNDGCNALHLAARNKQNFALKTMLSALRECNSNADPQKVIDAVNARGQTPLHCAVRAGDPDCVHYLLSAGASRNAVDNNLDTVAHYLGDVYNDAIYKEILETGNNEETESSTSEHTGNHLAKKNSEGYTPAHVAVKKLKLSLLEALIEAGAPLDVPDHDGETPLLTALNMDDTDAATLLAQHGCDVNVVSQNGDTPLKVACRTKNLTMIGRLIDAGSRLESLGAGEGRPAEADDDDVQRILNGERVEPAAGAHASRAADEEKECSEPERDEDSTSSELTSNDASTSYRLRSLIKGATLFFRLQKVSKAEAFSTLERGLPTTDDVSCLDYLTRLRLSKLLDVEDKWTVLADHLGCGHMVEFIRVCLDETSSPTMMLLDQYEQIPNANLSTVTQSLEDMGEMLGVRLIRAGNEQQ
ncbi:unnamed protein product [Gongylonema pulchrum]|uniref:ANK_REP_REGION domain-containing protein n=1 Tax=Gongylonema pulchrum TaxID=637853 RepID=A0A183DN84_9BILA|nr:unnamed protein product [Gongylonema pulchrum]